MSLALNNISDEAVSIGYSQTNHHLKSLMCKERSWSKLKVSLVHGTRFQELCAWFRKQWSRLKIKGLKKEQSSCYPWLPQLCFGRYGEVGTKKFKERSCFLGRRLTRFSSFLYGFLLELGGGKGAIGIIGVVIRVLLFSRSFVSIVLLGCGF